MALAALLLSVQSASAAGTVDPSVSCSLKKQSATLQAFTCLTKSRIAEIRGGTFDPAPCGARLTTRFQKQDDSGNCPTTGDAPVAFQGALDAEALLASTLDGDPEIVTRIQNTVRFAGCAASLIARSIRRGPFWAYVTTLEACYNIWEPVETGSLGYGYAYLAHAELAGMGRMQGMVGGNLSHADLTGNYIEWAAGVDFTNANLTEVKFEYGDISGADLTGADMTNLSGEQMISCDATLPPGWLCVEQVALAGSNLRFALVGPKAWLFGVNLSLSDLSGANLSSANLGYANLGGANLSGVTWSSTNCPDYTNSDANGGTCCGHHYGDPPAS